MKEKVIYNILSHSVQETESAGALLAISFKKDDFVALYGDLGAGKTAFVRGVCKVTAPESEVSSPSYGIVNEYEGKDFKVCHFDMYRIKSDDDLYSAGYYDYENCLTLAEWCENTPQILPEKYYKVQIDKVDENSRMIFVYLVVK